MVRRFLLHLLCEQGRTPRSLGAPVTGDCLTTVVRDGCRGVLRRSRPPSFGPMFRSLGRGAGEARDEGGDGVAPDSLALAVGEDAAQLECGKSFAEGMELPSGL